MPSILLVDEDRIFSAVYGRALEAAGFAVVLAHDARSAMGALGEQEFDAVITEVLLPGRNGLKLIQEIRLDGRWLDTPVYILTSLEAAEVGLAASLAQVLGVRAYLTKQQTPPAALVGALGEL